MKRPNLFPYCKLRRRDDGTMRPRFAPGPRERALGFVGEDLRHDDGRWFTLDEVATFAAKRAAEIVAARQTGKRVKATPAEAPRGRTVSALLDAYFASPDFKRLRPRTQLDYEKKAKAIRFRPAPARRVADMPGASRYAREQAFAASRPPLVPEVDDAVFFRFVVFALFMLLLGGVPLTWAPVAACACAAPEPVGVPVAGVCARAAAQPAAATMPTKV